MASAVETMIRNTVTKGIVKVVEFNQKRMTSDEPNPYLHGIHEPMDAELTIDDLKVTGKIPAELNGRYIRIGPNPVTLPNEAAYHWFTGDGMVHGVHLQGGEARWYRNRWIRNTPVAKALGETPAPGPRNGERDNVNTNIVGHAGKNWAIVEAGGYPVRIDDELDTIAYDNFGGSLKESFSAHPHIDADTGEAHAICYEATDPDKIRHVVVNKDGKVIREEPIKVQDGPSIHDCMITKNYVIILDMPVTFSMKTLLAGHSFPYIWNPDHKARIGLLPKKGSNDDVIWCEVEPCYVFHPCNAYETDDGKITFDACVHNNMFAQSTQGPDSSSVPFERWFIDPKTKTVERTILDTDNQEFPRPNEALIGKPYRYAYTMSLPAGFDTASFEQTKIYKHDVEAGTRETHDFGESNVPGEFVFVAKQGAKAEDDGWLMGYVINSAAETTDLVIVDAQDFEGPPVASVHIPHRIPPGFHGNWIAVS